jgi:hypothetical protein
MNDVKTIECKRDFAIGADDEIELTINNFSSFKETAWAHSRQ